MTEAQFNTRYLKSGSILALPAMGAGAVSGRGYPSGHRFFNRAGGKEYFNFGIEQSSLHVSDGVNYQIYDELFLLRPALQAANAYGKNTNFDVVGTNMTTALSTLSTTGGINVATAGASADQSILLPTLIAGQSALSAILWNTAKAIRFEANIKTLANITALQIWAGFKLTNTPVTVTDNDQTMFRYQDTVNSGKWQIIDSNNNTDNVNDSGVTVAINTRYHLVIQVDINRIPRYYINGVLVGTGAALLSTANLIPYIGIQAGAVAAKSIDITRLKLGILLS